MALLEPGSLVISILYSIFVLLLSLLASSLTTNLCLIHELFITFLVHRVISLAETEVLLICV